jgi:hypothetical protein
MEMTEISLTNKRILYIGPASFHYDQCFVKKLSELGADVTTYDFRNLYPDNLFSRLITKFKPQNKEAHKHKFYNQILLTHGYDFVLVRQGYQLDTKFLEKLRRLNATAKFINFHWDSIRPQFDYLPIMQYFDKIFSFDTKDCRNHPAISYLPLFYLDIYEEYKKNNVNGFQEKENDILFIGSWRNTERYHLIQLTENFCKKAQLRFYHYLHFSFKNQFQSVKNGIIPQKARTRKLSHKQIVDLFATTRTIIDFPSSFQTGLTIRTFETLGAGIKLITTNKNIANEPFYNPEYINIVDVDNFVLNIDFIKNPPTFSMDEKIKNYSIGNYINKLFQ